MSIVVHCIVAGSLWVRSYEVKDGRERWSAHGMARVSNATQTAGDGLLLKNGGLISCYEATTGRILYQAERIDAPGDYYSSAVGANGRIYIASQKGTVVVLDGGDALKILARNNLGEQIFATPAVLDGRIYLRGEKHLFVFGE